MLYLLPSEAKDSPHCPLVQTQPGHPQRKVALRISAFTPYYLTIQRVAVAETRAVPITDESPFTAKRARPDLFPNPHSPGCHFMPKQHQSPVPAAPGRDALTVAAADGASLCRCHAVLSWPFRRGPS